MATAPRIPTKINLRASAMSAAEKGLVLPQPLPTEPVSSNGAIAISMPSAPVSLQQQRVSNNIRRALINTYKAAKENYRQARQNGLIKKERGDVLNEFTPEVIAASKRVKNALNIMKRRGIPLNSNMALEKPFHNQLATRRGGKRKASRKASRKSKHITRRH